jgi:hypothetical protein
MNPHENSKLNQREKEQASVRQDAGQNTQSAIAEFASPEEMLRYDASQTDLPPNLAERLRESVQKEPRPRSWWQRLFGNS